MTTESTERDPRQTSLAFLIRSHYRYIADELDFPAERYRALAAVLKINVYELGAIVRMTPAQVDGYLEIGKFPATVEFSLYMVRQAIVSQGHYHHGFPRLPIDPPAGNPAPCSST